MKIPLQWLGNGDLNPAQAVFNKHWDNSENFTSSKTFATSHPSNVWTESLVIPAYIAAASLFVLAVHGLWKTNFVQVTLLRRALASEENNSSLPSIYKQRKTSPVIFAFYLTRFLASAALFGISIASYLQSSNDGLYLRLPLIFTYGYATVLGLLSICVSNAEPVWHLNVILLSTFVVHFVRNIYPLMTFTKAPADGLHNHLLWAEISLLVVSSLLVPLLVPRQYIPVNPNEPMEETNPEQTASILSLAFYGFLDPVVWEGNRQKHLKSDDLPTLADYDYSKNLKARSFKHLDFYAGAKNRHLFFGLMRTFRVEYVVMCVMIVLNVLGYFASPIGINRLLNYMETDGENAIVQPWVWVLWIFLGPTIGTLAIQWYIFIATRTLVRAESIITQLVFDHSLRIRMKAETDKSTSKGPEPSTSSATTPDSVSVAESDEHTLHSAVPTEGETVTSADETLQDSVSDAGTSSSSRKPKQEKKGSKEDGQSSANNLVGKINNLVTTDLGNIVEARDFLFGVLYIPLQVALCIWFLYALLGWSALIGLVTILALFPIPGFVAKKVQDVQVVQLKRSDARVQIITDVMNVLRMIKLFAWERKMDDKIKEKREAELQYIRYRKFLDMLNGNLNFIIPCVVMLATFSVHTAVMGESLTASKVFSSLTVFDMLRDQLHTIFYAITQTLTGKVSLDRVNDFLKNTELLDEFHDKADSLNLFPSEIQSDDRIGFRNASFTWSADVDGSLTPSKRRFMLRIDDELLFEKQKINLVIGPTGSGKTSLLMALLGEMHFNRTEPDSWFNLPRAHGVAYASQEPFIQNATIKENILFGEPYDEARYRTVLRQCALERDLTLFEAGDQTEVGEKGLTLSGGQKARVSLARAVYSSKSILLLDDVLAALDVHTSKWIVEKCFSQELLRDRTVILVTHNVALCRPIASFVVSMDINGRIHSRGPTSLALSGDVQLEKEIKEEEQAIQKAQEEVDPQSEGAAESKKSDGKLILAEETAEGHVSWAALKLYFKGMGGSHPFIFFASVVFGLLATEILNTSQTLWLGLFAREYSNHPGKPEAVPVAYYLTIYTILLLIAVLVYCTSIVNYIFGAIRASRAIHQQLIEAIFGTTLRWLDTTPTSRVITRATQDIRAIDSPLNQFLWFLCEMTSTMLVKFIAVIVSAPAFLLPGLFVAALGGWTGQVYIAAQLSVKREMSAAKSPVLGHFGAAIAGLTSIRAYNAQNAFVKEQQERINRYTRAARTFYNLNRWVCVRIDLISSVFAAALAAYLVYGRRGDSTRTGFTLNMAIGFSSLILWWIRVLNEFEVQGNSLERIQEYVDIEQEPKSTEAGNPPASWPTSGDLRVENLSARYSPEGPKVLKDISFHIPAGQRVGVVGRTGSGKSSLTLALLRCIFTEGSVIYDGLRTLDVNLEALRSQITIIPQMPELLSGSLRENLDPFDLNDDATLNDALRAAGLFTLQKDMEEGQITLDSQISSSGSNLSVGQRQIIALARAIIRGSKLLILDEATSAIDFATDSIIQSSLRTELKSDVTLITIAHRLQTVFDFDRIMVLDAGNLIEFDSPLNLLNMQGSFLRKLVDESPDKEVLWAMAEGREHSERHD